MKLTEFQRKEFSKYWFDLSKLSVISLILKLFEPNAPEITNASLSTIASGLTMALLFVILGLIFSRRIRK